MFLQSIKVLLFGMSKILLYLIFFGFIFSNDTVGTVTVYEKNGLDRAVDLAIKAMDTGNAQLWKPEYSNI